MWSRPSRENYYIRIFEPLLPVPLWQSCNFYNVYSFIFLLFELVEIVNKPALVMTIRICRSGNKSDICLFCLFDHQIQQCLRNRRIRYSARCKKKFHGYEYSKEPANIHLLFFRIKYSVLATAYFRHEDYHRLDKA